MQKALDFRAELMEAGACEYSLNMTVEQGERVYTFEGSCNYHCDQGATIVLTEPEALSGICFEVDEQGATVSLEKVSVEVGPIAGRRIQPLEVPYLLGECWTSAYIEACGADENGNLIIYASGYGTDQFFVHTRLDDDTGLPVVWEIYYEDTRILYGEIQNFSFV